mgnify:FL=1
MSQHTTEYLVREITQYLKHCPEAANELLAAVAEGMRYYKHDVLAARNIQTVNNLSMVYSVITKKKLTRTELACVLPSLFITFPKAKITGHSGTDVEILQKYLDGVKSYYGASEDDFYKYRGWIETCHGREMSEWFDELADNAKSSGMIKFDW